jgi:ADP-dependent NAD(P)H-hydrate dehydratase / NAD(P)H-hydrate epimerase
MGIHAIANTAVMVRPVDGAGELTSFLADPRFNVVALGPGLGVGAQTREFVLAALAGARAVVLDADALTSFAGHGDILAAAIKGRPGGTILTPHDGEFSRLFNDVAAPLEAKTERARKAAAASGAIVVLKGADTVVAAPDGQAVINANAPPWLATAGSGDVLAGIIAAMLAQGMAPLSAACAGVWLHGEAGAAVGPGVIAEDLADQLPAVLQRVMADASIVGSPTALG